MENRCISVNVALALLCTALTANEDPKLMFLRAREMQQSNGGNDSAGAIALYKKVIAALPDSSEAQLRLSEAQLEVQDFEGALKSARKAAELAPRSAEAATNLAIIEFAMAKRPKQNSADAKAALLKATKLSPGDPELLFRLADICESSQDNYGALNAWLRLGNIRPHMNLGDQPLYVVAYERAAYLAYSLKCYNERREACLALAKEPNATDQHLRMLEDLARNQVEQGYLSHAEESFALLAKRFPDEPTVWQNIALVQRQAAHFEEAIESLKIAQSLKPEPRNVIHQAYCLMNIGKLQEAYNILQDLLKQADFTHLGDYLEHARGFLASSLLLLNRPKDLVKIMGTWDGVSESQFLFSQYAQSLLQSNDMKNARTALKEGMERFPEQLLFRLASTIPTDILEGASTYANESNKNLHLIDLKALAYLWAEFRQWEKCLEVIQEVNKVSPNQDVEILLLKSNALESLNQREEALNVLRICQTLAPEHSVIQNNLGYHLLENNGDIQEAASLIKSALEQEPDNSSYLDSWGWVQFKQGQFNEAEATLQKAVEANPLSPETRKHLGEVLLSLNRPKEALEQWERALAFVFPDREKLEAQTRKLKTDLAKKALEEAELNQEPNSYYNDDDGWQQ